MLSPQTRIAHRLMLFRKVFGPTLYSQNVTSTFVNKIFVQKATLFKFKALAEYSTTDI